MNKSNLDIMKVKDIIQNSFFLRLPGAKNILNLGAADGNFYEKYPWTNYNLTNLDNNSEGNVFENDCVKKYSNKKYPNIKNIVGNCNNMPMFNKDEFDMVIFTHLIEHLKPDEIKKTLSEIQRVLKKNGILIVSTPNYKIRKFLCMNKANEFHIKEFTYQELKKILEEKYSILNEFGALHINVETFMMQTLKTDDPENSYVMWMICRNKG